jgi:hypothetical protein
MNLKKLLLLIAFVSIGLASCENDEFNNETDEGNGTMSASIDGISWEAIKITMAKWQSDQLHIQGEASDGSLIQISLLDADESGTYTVGGVTTVNLAMYEQDDNNGWTTNVMTPEGTVVVSQLSASGTKGTFNFVGSNAVTEKNITNGKFDIKF